MIVCNFNINGFCYLFYSRDDPRLLALLCFRRRNIFPKLLLLSFLFLITCYRYNYIFIVCGVCVVCGGFFELCCFALKNI